jgi:hypothetical protein
MLRTSGCYWNGHFSAQCLNCPPLSKHILGMLPLVLKTDDQTCAFCHTITFVLVCLSVHQIKPGHSISISPCALPILQQTYIYTCVSLLSHLTFCSKYACLNTRVGQNRVYTPYMTVYLVISLLNYCMYTVYGSGSPIKCPSWADCLQKQISWHASTDASHIKLKAMHHGSRTSFIIRHLSFKK